MTQKGEILLKFLSKFTLEDALLLEEHDRQYRALKRLHGAINDNELFLKLVITNALMSYQLPTKGENYWENFAAFFSKNPDLQRFEEFLKLYNNRFLSGKLRRLQKVLRAVQKLDRKMLTEFCKNPKALLEYLSKELNQPKDAKTLVFAIKMFVYACRIATGRRIVAPFDIEIPLDVRLRKISQDLSFWRKLAERLGIPPLHLDALVWVTMGATEKFLGELPEDLREKVLNLKRILKELTS